MIKYWFFPLAIITTSYACVLISPYFFILPYVWVLILVPVLELFINKLNKTDNELLYSKGHDASLIIVFPLLFLLLILALLKISYLNLTYYESLFIGLGTGIAGGAVGITTAHELIHRKSKKMKAIGVALLAICFYSHFRIEHIYGHHIHVATKNDPATARKGENFYKFLIRCVVTCYFSAWKIEKDILSKKNLSFFSFKNRMIHYTAFNFLLLLSCFAVAKLNGLIFIFTHSAISIILLEVVEYIQHYGLVRERSNNETLEKYNHSHSWNSRHSIADWSTFNLGLHAEHHSISNKPYPLLSHGKKIREMPVNYPTMILMALIPPIWFKVIDKKI